MHMYSNIYGDLRSFSFRFAVATDCWSCGWWPGPGFLFPNLGKLGSSSDGADSLGLGLSPRVMERAAQEVGPPGPSPHVERGAEAAWARRWHGGMGEAGRSPPPSLRAVPGAAAHSGTAYSPRPRRSQRGSAPYLRLPAPRVLRAPHRFLRTRGASF